MNISERLTRMALTLLISVSTVALPAAAGVNEDLQAAADRCDPVNVKAALDQGADAKTVSKYGFPALFRTAMYCDAPDTVNLLLDKGAEVNKPAPATGRSALLAVIESG